MLDFNPGIILCQMGNYKPVLYIHYLIIVILSISSWIMCLIWEKSWFIFYDTYLKFM